VPPLTDQRLAEAAFLYYVQTLSQADVAARLNVSRSNVSRMLRAAREKNIIRFEVDYPTVRDEAREKVVRDAFAESCLREVIVAQSEHDVESQDDDGVEDVKSLLSVCRAASKWLPTVLNDGLTIGLSWGRTIQTFVDSSRIDARSNVHVVQLAGEASLHQERSGHDLVRDLAERLGGTHSYFNAPAVAPSEEVARSLLESPVVAEALRRAREADIALLGVGQFNMGSTTVFLEELAQASSAELDEAYAKNVVGQICGRFFDSSGVQVDLEVSRRVVSVDLEDLRTMPTVAILAVGREKAEAVRAAVLGGFAHVLIIDAQLAEAILALERSLDETMAS
jgi:deoxyribonucleoside regulator